LGVFDWERVWGLGFFWDFGGVKMQLQQLDIDFLLIAPS
jgi:hypothetical protein